MSNGYSSYLHAAESLENKAREMGVSIDESIGRQIYKHLMNGVSHVLLFVICGVIILSI